MKGFFLLLPIFIIFYASITHSEFTGSIDIGQRRHSPVIIDSASMNETGIAAEEIPAFDFISLIILSIAVILVAASIYLIGRHI